MKKFNLLAAVLMLLIPIGLRAGHYVNFRCTSYVAVGTINQVGTFENWEKIWEGLSQNVKIDKVYLETYRDQQFVKESAMQAAIKFFKSKGIEVQGGITYNWSGGGRQRWDSFCYSNPENLKEVKRISEMTAKLFDEIVLDDYYFTNCKCDLCIDAKGKKSWNEFRMDLLDKVARECIVGPAHKVNPNCKVIVKYPNWYDHFHGLGFDLKRGPYTFDGVYTGTETRDATAEQHLQAYESFAIMRYYENIRPAHNFGGWIDTGGATYPDLFAEQLWLTALSKGPEVNLFSLANMWNPFREGDRPWASRKTSLNLTELRVESAKRGVDNPTWGRIAEYALDKIDPILSKLGTPKGIKAYKPYNTDGEEFLHNYMGMIGIPVEIVPVFPEFGETTLVIITECCAGDPDILNKLTSFMRKGGEVVVTSGFYRAMQDKGIKNIFAMQATDRKADVDTLLLLNGGSRSNRYLVTDVPVKIPVFTYYTNDSWEDISSLSYENGWPILQYSIYSKGDIYVWVIPDNFSHLYALPAPVLDRLRQVTSADMDVQIEGPSQVALFTYDNDTFVVHSFHDTPVTINLVTRGQKGLTDLASGETIEGTNMEQSPRIYGRTRYPANRATVTVEPHSFRAFKIN